MGRVARLFGLALSSVLLVPAIQASHQGIAFSGKNDDINPNLREEAERFWEEGIGYMRADNFPSALPPLKEALQYFCDTTENEDGDYPIPVPIAPENFEDCVNLVGTLGIVYAAIGDYESAASFYRTANILSNAQSYFLDINTQANIDWHENFIYLDFSQYWNHPSYSSNSADNSQLGPGVAASRAANIIEPQASQDYGNIYLSIGQ